MELTKRITPEVEALLNERVKVEYQSAYMYYGMANYCNMCGFYKAKDKYRQYAEEELKHAHKLEDYINDRNGIIELQILPKADTKFKSLKDAIVKSYEHEIQITEAYKKLSMRLCENDVVTYQFLIWFITEQIEEEAKFGDLLVLAERLGITDDTKGVELTRLEDELAK